MKPISHRGFWTHPGEHNTEGAFRRSLEAGFGIETDLRDRLGEIVIAHDMSSHANMTFEAFLRIYRQYPGDLPLALNVKADGLQDGINTLLQAYSVANYFVFDMSVPDMLGYCRRDMKCFTRESEIEAQPSLYDECCGVWLDQFYSDWIDHKAIARHVDAGKMVCIVSPELHKRDHQAAWRRYRDHAGQLAGAKDMVLLCTDHPSLAKEMFAP